MLLIALVVREVSQEIPLLPSAPHRNLGKLTRWIEQTRQLTVPIDSPRNLTAREEATPVVKSKMPDWGTVKDAGSQPESQFRRTGQAPEIAPAASKVAKKKKRKKHQVARKTIQNQYFSRPELPSRLRSSDQPLGGSLIAMGAAIIPAARDAVNLENPKTLKDWLAVIERDGHFNGVAKLIREYQAKRVEDDLFYQVVDNLLSSREARLREQGLMALSATPNLLSYSRLLKYLPSESSARLREFGLTSLNSYRDISYLTLLSNYLLTANGDGLAVTLDILRGLVESEGTPSSPGHSTNLARVSRGVPPPTAVPAAQRQGFLDLAASLNRIEQIPSNQPLRDNIRGLLALIEQLMRAPAVPGPPITPPNSPQSPNPPGSPNPVAQN